MFTRALGARTVERRRLVRSSAPLSAVLLALLVAGCGGTTASGDRQDAGEPSGDFPVSVESASFPLRQDLAESTEMKIVVRNAGSRPVPNIAVTVQCENEKNGQNGSFDRQIASEDVADKNRPNFVVDRIPGPDRPNGRDQLDPLERSSAYVNTYTLGPLAPNRTKTFVWKVTAVRAGDFRVCYRVAAGLNGKARAVPAEGSLPLSKEWNGVVSSAAPQTGVAPDGQTITTLPQQSSKTP
jgi:hypothetical protein